MEEERKREDKRHVMCAQLRGFTQIQHCYKDGKKARFQTLPSLMLRRSTSFCLAQTKDFASDVTYKWS